VTETADPRLTIDPDRAVDTLRAGGLVGLPTETVYGLAADAANVDAVRRVFDVKGRPVDHPLIVHVAGVTDLDRWAAEVPETARVLVERWWPGPLTVLVRRASHVLAEITGGRDTVAVRAPSHPLAHEVLVRFGGGLVAPSANRFGRVSPTTATDVLFELGDRVDLVLDGGPCTVGVESTIVDLTGGRPVVLRLGGITPAQIADTVGTDVEVAGDAAVPVAPGMLASHYAPDADVVLLPATASDTDVVHVVAALVDAGHLVGVLAPARVEGLPAGVVQLEPGGEAEQYAQVLYARLRLADAQGVRSLVVVPPSPEGIGAAVLDRLTRAAHR
jgi:L-threonylcarbamoyladenylate synthase